jgi:hypothetical protein
MDRIGRLFRHGDASGALRWRTAVRQAGASERGKVGAATTTRLRAAQAPQLPSPLSPTRIFMPVTAPLSRWREPSWQTPRGGLHADSRHHLAVQVPSSVPEHGHDEDETKECGYRPNH